VPCGAEPKRGETAPRPIMATRRSQHAHGRGQWCGDRLVDLDKKKKKKKHKTASHQAWVHYDIAIVALLLATRWGRKTSDWAAVRFEPPVCVTDSSGLRAAAGSFLTPTDTTISMPRSPLNPLEPACAFFFSGFTSLKHLLRPLSAPQSDVPGSVQAHRSTKSRNAIRSIIDACDEPAATGRSIPFEASLNCGGFFAGGLEIKPIPRRLQIRYRLAGPMDQLVCPPPAGKPRAVISCGRAPVRSLVATQPTAYWEVKNQATGIV